MNIGFALCECEHEQSTAKTHFSQWTERGLVWTIRRCFREPGCRHPDPAMCFHRLYRKDHGPEMTVAVDITAVHEVGRMSGNNLEPVLPWGWIFHFIKHGKTCSRLCKIDRPAVWLTSTIARSVSFMALKLGLCADYLVITRNQNG
jgi:hypothetical protein